MKLVGRIKRDEQGAAAIEMAFALPVLITLIYMFIQLAQIYRAVAGIQQALGEGARLATLCRPTATGCTVPTPAEITNKIQASVYGIGPGNFTYTTPALTNDTVNGGQYYDLKVDYNQSTTFLFIPGPTISVTRSKRVWVAT